MTHISVIICEHHILFLLNQYAFHMEHYSTPHSWLSKYWQFQKDLENVSLPIFS